MVWKPPLTTNTLIITMQLLSLAFPSSKERRKSVAEPHPPRELQRGDFGVTTDSAGSCSPDGHEES